MIQAVKTVRERIRWILESKNLSESALSKKAGLARSHVGSYLADRIHALSDETLADRIHALSDETLAALARAADVRVEWLRDGIGDPSSALDIQRGIEHESLLDALVTAFRRHPDANMSDLDAVRRLIQGDAAPKIPMERAVDILSGWLTASRALRLRGELVSWDTLAIYLSNPHIDAVPPTRGDKRN